MARMAVDEKAMEVVDDQPSRIVPFTAATLSFVYHLLLAILSNYVPPDRNGAALTLWIYSWTASILCYFGVIAIVSKRSTLTTAFGYLLFLDCLFSALWRFALLEYVVNNHYRDACGSLQEIHDGCVTRFNLVHAGVAAFLFLVSFSEVLLADSVRRFARSLRKPAPIDGEDVPLPVTYVEHVIGWKV